MYVDPIYGFNVDILNRRLKCFNYGFADIKNKPSPIFTKQMTVNVKDHKIKQKAAQTWCLVRFMPFILKGFILPSDPYFHIIHLLSRIMQIVFSPVITKGLVYFLESLIIQHHEELKKIFPDVNLINKHHYLVHYPDCLIHFGPLVKMWCMRYEAKHIFFKRRALVNCNFKSITKSLAVVHQIAHCSVWSTNNPFAVCTTLTSEESVWITSCERYSFLKVLGFNDEYSVKIAKTVTFNGVDYRNGIFIWLKTASDNKESLPLFYQVKEIVILPDDGINFLVKLWRTTHFKCLLH